MLTRHDEQPFLLPVMTQPNKLRASQKYVPRWNEVRILSLFCCC